MQTARRGTHHPKPAGDAVFRWECRCQEPPVLLGTYDSAGNVNLKAGDRYWHVVGQVRATCPRCGTEHVLDPQLAPSSTD